MPTSNSATTKATVRNFTMKAGQSAVTLDATITRPLALMGKIGKVDPAGVDFTAALALPDLAELLPVTPGSPVLPNARGKGTVAIERLKNQKLDVSHLSATRSGSHRACSRCRATRCTATAAP